MIGYINIEDGNGYDDFCLIADQIVQEFPNLDLEVIENSSYYIVLKVVYDEYEEIQDLVSTIAYLLVSANICRFTITINCD